MKFLLGATALLISLLYSPIIGLAQTQELPKTLEMDILLSQPKFRNIHHDGFSRADNATEIGNNARPDRPSVLAYKTMCEGEVHVGIKNGCATNFIMSRTKGRTIKFVDACRNDFHITAVRPKETNDDLKVGFFIEDVNHFYYVKLCKKKYEVFRYINGIRKKVARGWRGGCRLELYVEGNVAEIIIDQKAVESIHLKEWEQTQHLCGLVFENTSVSSVDDFIVDYRDKFVDAGIDEAVERGDVIIPRFGTYCASEGVCTASTTYVKDGEKSYRFVLKKPTQAQVKASRDNALHSTIMLDGIKEKGGYDYAGRRGGNKPQDSFILSFDILFPSTGNEKWELDEFFQELFVQEHHIYYDIPFSPSLAIYIDKGRLFLNTIWNDAIAKGKKVEENNLHHRYEYIARINNDEEELYLMKKGYGNFESLYYLEKGQWHNFTLYVKLGYNENQQPRTVLYLDGIKVIDWTTPNAYNCQEFGEYLEFGIYKWSWNTQANREKTPIRQRVLYFDNIHYYI